MGQPQECFVLFSFPVTQLLTEPFNPKGSPQPFWVRGFFLGPKVGKKLTVGNWEVNLPFKECLIRLWCVGSSLQKSLRSSLIFIASSWYLWAGLPGLPWIKWTQRQMQSKQETQFASYLPSSIEMTQSTNKLQNYWFASVCESMAISPTHYPCPGPRLKPGYFSNLLEHGHTLSCMHCLGLLLHCSCWV